MAMLVRALGLALALLCVVRAAHADMWTYVDERGVKHFASSQLDRRYKLMFRGMPSPDAGGAFAGAEGSVAPSRLLGATAPVKAFGNLEFSPGFMAVKPHVRSAADANQLDMALLQAVIATESGFDASAVSPKGAVGLMQVMPATGQRYGLTNDRSGTVATKLTDPKTNIHTGARYLRDLIKLFPGQLELALAAYNAGEGAVQRAGNRIPNYKETQNYVRSVLQLYKRLNPQALVASTAAAGTRVVGEFHGSAPSTAGQTANAELPASDLSN